MILEQVGRVSHYDKACLEMKLYALSLFKYSIPPEKEKTIRSELAEVIRKFREIETNVTFLILDAEEQKENKSA